MTLYSVILFFHVLGVVLLFAAFGLEWVCLRGIRRAASIEQVRAWTGAAAVTPRFHAFSGPLIIFAGAYLATKMQAWPQGWISMSLLGVVGMMALGMGVSAPRMRALGKASMQPSALLADSIGRAQAPVFRYSLRIRLALGLGIILLMGSKSPLGISAAVMGVAVVAGLIAGAVGPSPKAVSA